MNVICDNVTTTAGDAAESDLHEKARGASYAVLAWRIPDVCSHTCRNLVGFRRCAEELREFKHQTVNLVLLSGKVISDL